MARDFQRNDCKDTRKRAFVENAVSLSFFSPATKEDKI